MPSTRRSRAAAVVSVRSGAAISPGLAGRDRLTSVSDVFPVTSHPADHSFVDGRRKELVNAVMTMLVPGMCPVIVGARGMGKTTLAWQLALAVEGSTEILDYLGLSAYQGPVEYFHEVVWLTCAHLKQPDGRGILDAIAERLRARREALAPDGTLATVERSTTLSFSMSPKFEYTSKSGPRVDRSDTAMPLEEEILELAAGVTAQTKHPLLFMIDDIHLADDVQPFCSFAKNSSAVSPANPRFALVGTADRLGDLLRGSHDIGGIAASIPLHPMDDREILKLLEWGIVRLQSMGLHLEINSSVLKSLARVSAGCPATASQLARTAIITAEREGSTRVTRLHLDTALRDVMAGLQSTAPGRRY